MDPSFLQWKNSTWLFDRRKTAHASLFDHARQPWDALAALGDYILALLEDEVLQLGSSRHADDESEGIETDYARGASETNDVRETGGVSRKEIPVANLRRVTSLPGVQLTGELWVGKDTEIEPGVTIEGPVRIGSGCRVEPGVLIRGPSWIGDNCEIRQAAYLRGFVLAADNVVLGHACEFKHCALLGYAQAPHFNYVGDSILGFKAHIGAGVILSNVRLDKRTVKVSDFAPSKERIETGLEKFGAIIGDECEIGCNSVLNPGTILGAHCCVLPLSRVSGTWAQNSRIQ